MYYNGPVICNHSPCQSGDIEFFLCKAYVHVYAQYYREIFMVKALLKSRCKYEIVLACLGMESKALRFHGMILRSKHGT